MNIKEAAKISDLTPNTIRYYERLGVIPEIPRDANGNRNFGDLELQWLSFTKNLRSAGVHVENIIDYAKLVAQGDSSVQARVDLLLETRDEIDEKILELQSTRDHIQFKIDNYDAHMTNLESKLANKEME